MSFSFSKFGKVVTPLKAHQQRVVDRIQQDDQPGLVVAHGLGTGKTLTSIAAQDALKTPATVVVPAALQGNYEKERKKHLKGPSQPANIVSLQNSARKGTVPSNPLLVVDEAHRAREAGTATQKALKNSDAQKRLLLTGSPFYNSPGDLSPLINIAAGKDVLPNNRYDFERQYIRNQNINPSLMGRFSGIRPGQVPMLDQSKAPVLRDVYKKWVDYHPGSSEGFPTVSRETVNVPMHPKQLELYDSIIGEAPSWVSKKVLSGLPPSKQESSDLNAWLNGARQVGLSTAPYVDEGQEYQSPKVDEAFRRLQEHFKTNPESRAVVYSNYLRGGISPYRKRLDEAQIPYGEFTGEVDRLARDQLVRDYNEGKKKVLLLSSAGGEGLDLKGTRLMQLLEPHWNSEKLHQVEGRGVRFQSHGHLPEDQRNVHVEQYISTRPAYSLAERIRLKRPGGSADEYLASRSAEKDKLIQQFRDLLPTYEEPVQKAASVLEQKIQSTGRVLARLASA